MTAVRTEVDLGRGLVLANPVLTASGTFGYGLEEHMACGFGVCLGCVVPVKGATDEYGRYRRSCVEGPVFLASELDW